MPELDRSGDTPLLRLARESRDDANLGEWWVEWDVYELDGPARFAMRRPYEQGVECGYQDSDLTEGYWVLAAIGQDEGTSGVDLVWMEGSGRQPGDVTYPTRSIMTSPWTTDPTALRPRRLRSDLSTSFGTDSSRFKVACGRAAKSGGVATRDIQIVSLGDGSGWNLIHTPQQWGAIHVVGLTCDEIILVVQYWEGGAIQGTTLQRIRFDALGEPLPPD